MTQTSEATMEYKNIYQRIHSVMQRVDYVQKEAKKQGIQYTFVSHDAVTAKIRPELVAEGVIYFPQDMKYSQDGNKTIVEINLHFVCVDKPEDKLIVPSFGFGIDNQDKGPGKAVSYAVKYALLKTFGLETGDDPEKDDIDHKPKPVDDRELDMILDEISSAKSPIEFQNVRAKARAAHSRMEDEQISRVADAVKARLIDFPQAPLNGHHHA